MESMHDLQCLLRRQSEIRAAMRRPGGIRVTVERELLAIQERLRALPELVPKSSGGEFCARP